MKNPCFRTHVRESRDFLFFEGRQWLIGFLLATNIFLQNVMLQYLLKKSRNILDSEIFAMNTRGMVEFQIYKAMPRAHVF